MDGGRSPPDEAKERARLRAEERSKRIAELVQRRSKLTPSEVELLDEIYGDLIDVHVPPVLRHLRRRLPEDPAEAEDLMQEALVGLHAYIVENGFPDLGPMLKKIAHRRFLNFVRDKLRDPESVGLMSSSSMKPKKWPDAEGDMDVRTLAQRIDDTLTAQQRHLFYLVMVCELTMDDVADALEIPVPTVKARVQALKRVLVEIAEEFLMESEEEAQVNDVERWIYLDGPEPELLRPLFDALREPPRVTQADSDRITRRFFASLDAGLAGNTKPGAETASPEERAPGAPSPPAGEEPAARLALRVVEAEPEPVPPPAPPIVEPAPSARSSVPEAFKITALAAELSPEARALSARLPFEPPAPPAPGKAATKTKQVPIQRASFGKTFPLGTEASQVGIAALPFAGSPVGDAVVAPPILTLPQYASLHAELALEPTKRADTLRLYGVANDATLRVLDERWRKALADHPEMRAAFDKGVETYTIWLRTQGK